ncbi:MAG TPA: hypothetical protein VF121_02540, partial [Thermoanaerobaculia bacterium]|nr:hypothetical protein [Thermoanaerobaculia bacterium]
VLGAQVRASWAPEALARARALDPLQPLPRDAAWLEIGRETSAASSFSLYLFRRRPWPAPLARGTLPISAGSAENPAGKGRDRDAKVR